MARTKSTPFWSSTTSTSSQAPAPAASAPVPLGRSDSVKFGRNGEPIVPARYDDPLSKSIYFNGKAYSTTPARATDEEIEDDLAQMRKTWDGRPYVKPASPKEVLPEFDDYGYKGRIIKKPKSKLESNIRNAPPTGEELVNGSQPKDEEAGVSIETSETRGEPLNTNERFWGCKFRGGEEEPSVTISDTRYKTFPREEVFQPNQAPGEEAESSFAKSDAPRVPFMKKVVQDSQPKAKEAEPLLEARNARDELLTMKEVVQDNQLKDKEVESSVASGTPTTLAPVNCAVDTGVPATGRKRKISEISELTNGSPTSLDGQMPQTENEEGPPHKKLRTANGAVSLPVPPEKPATPKKAIPARAKKPAAQRARRASSGRARKPARVGKAPSAVDKSAAKAAPSAIPAGAKTPSANAEEPAGEPAVVAKSVAVVVVTRAASRGIVGKDKSPTATAPEMEGPIGEIITNQEDKSSTSSESGDDLEKDGSYAPVAPRKRRVARKGKAPVAPKKRAASNKAVSSEEEKATTLQEDEPSAAIPEVGAGLEIANTKSAAVPKSRCSKRKATGLEDENAVQEEVVLPVTPEVDAALITRNPAPAPPRRYARKPTAPKDAIIKLRTTSKVDTALATETDKPAPRPRKRARKEANILEDGAIAREGIQQLACPEADAARKTQRAGKVPTRRSRRRNNTSSEEANTRATTTPAEMGTVLTKENPEPAAGPKRSGRRNGNAPEAEATAQKEVEPLAAPGADAALITENPAPAPPGRYVRRKATAPEEVITKATTIPEMGTIITKENPEPAAGPKRSGRNGNAPEAEATAQKEAEPLAATKADAALITENSAPAPPGHYLRRKATAPEEVITKATTTPAEMGTILTKENPEPAAGPKRRGRRNGNAPEAETTAQKEAESLAAPGAGAALTTEKPTPAPRRRYAKRKATVPEAATGPPTVPKVSTTSAGVADTSQRWRRNIGAHTVEIVNHPDNSVKIDNTKPSAATRSRGLKRKATQLEDKEANQQNAEPAPAPVVSASQVAEITKLAPTPKRSARETITTLQDITTTLLDIPKADAALAQGSSKPAAGPRERKKRRGNTPEVGATVQQEAGPPTAPEEYSALTAKKQTPAPTIDSLRREIAAPEEHAPPTAISENPAGVAETAAPATTPTPPARVRRPRYRIPAEGSRKSTRIKAQHDKLK